MYYGRLDANDLEAAANERSFKRRTQQQYNDLRSAEKRLFDEIVKLSKGRQWVTREQIAERLRRPRLVPHDIKLLEHLSDGKRGRDPDALHWLDKTKRPHFRQTYDGRRPAGYEWVYRPKMDVIEALLPDEPQPVAARPAPTSSGGPVTRLLRLLGVG